MSVLRTAFDIYNEVEVAYNTTLQSSAQETQRVADGSPRRKQRITLYPLSVTLARYSKTTLSSEKVSCFTYQNIEALAKFWRLVSEQGNHI